MYINIEKRSKLSFDNGFGKFQRGHAGLPLEKKAKVTALSSNSFEAISPAFSVELWMITRLE
jgi:hypothetical protein